MTDYSFKLGMYLPELRLPFDEALAKAKDIGAEYVWFNSLPDEPPIAEMTDAEIDRMGERVARTRSRDFCDRCKQSLQGTTSNRFRSRHVGDRIRRFSRNLITSSVPWRSPSV